MNTRFLGRLPFKTPPSGDKRALNELSREMAYLFSALSSGWQPGCRNREAICCRSGAGADVHTPTPVHVLRSVTPVIHRCLLGENTAPTRNVPHHMKALLWILALLIQSPMGSALAGVAQPLGGTSQLVIPAAASGSGANGTFFKSAITIVNRTNHDQVVAVR
jgi:hypothetical protein